MKLKLLLLLLFISTISFAQNWSQVGAAEFTNFASDGAITTHPTTSDIYVAVVEPLSSNKISVKKFDGSNWIAVGGILPDANTANLAVKINPFNNQPYVAYRNSTTNKMSCYTFNGTTWQAVFTEQGSSGLSNHRLQIQFNSAGTIRVAARLADQRLHITECDLSGVVTSIVKNQISRYANGYYNADHRYDFVSFDKYYVSRSSQGSYESKPYHSLANVDDSGTTFRYYGGQRDVHEISGDLNSKYYATSGGDGFNRTPSVKIYKETTYITSRSGGNGIVEFKKSQNNNQFYLMYKSANNIVFENYRTDFDKWSTLPSLGLDTSVSGFFIKMIISEFDGNLYVLYMDNGKVSVKTYNITIPLNLSRIYVNKNATGNSDGSSWSNAFTNINTALENIGSNTTEIWVAKGTYKPSATDRAKSFNFSRNLNIYGSFVGTETSKTERDIVNNPTILSGDLNGDDAGAVSFSNTTKADNSYNIVKVSAEDVLLDGFTITNANANGSTQNEQEGSAITLLPTVKKITLNNCNLINNTANRAGVVSAIDNKSNVAITFSNSSFKNNLAKFSTILYSRPSSSKTLTFNSINSLYANNTVDNVNGSGMFWFRNDAGSCTINTSFTNDTFVNNTTNRNPSAGNDLSVIDIGQTRGTVKTEVNNTIFWNNTDGNGALVPAIGRNGNNTYPVLTNMLVNNSLDPDNFSKITYKQNILTSDPLFKSATDFSLQANSPAINVGDNSKIPADINYDIIGNDRIIDTTVDLGAYEFDASAVAGLSDINKIAFSVHPNPTVNVLNIKLNEDIKLVEIYNLQGQKVLFSKLKTINTSKLSNGIYLLKITTTTDNVGVKRFLKQ